MGLISAVRGEEAADEQEMAEPTEGMPAEAAPSRGNDESDDNDQESGDSQKWYDRTVSAAMSIIHKQGAEEIAQALTAGANQPAEALGGAASSLVIQIDDKLKGDIPADVVLPAAGEVLGLVAEFADARGIFTANRRQIEQAMVLMLQQLMTHYGVSQEDMKAFMDTTGKEHAQEIAEGLHSVSASVAGGAPPGSRGTAAAQPAQELAQQAAPQEAEQPAQMEAM